MDSVKPLNLLSPAMHFAVRVHGNQKYGRKPYHAHLIDVVNVLRRFIDWDDLSQEMIDAAWLHDSIEDTDTTAAEIAALFGERTRELVVAVTNEQGENRKERHAKTYPKIRGVPGALLLKLADRIANIEQSISHNRVGRPPQKIFNMYLKEWNSFQEELKGRCEGEGEIEKMMWDYLTELMNEGIEKMQRFKSIKTFNGEV